MDLHKPSTANIKVFRFKNDIVCKVPFSCNNLTELLHVVWKYYHKMQIRCRDTWKYRVRSTSFRLQRWEYSLPYSERHGIPLPISKMDLLLTLRAYQPGSVQSNQCEYEEFVTKYNMAQKKMSDGEMFFNFAILSWNLGWTKLGTFRSTLLLRTWLY